MSDERDIAQTSQRNHAQSGAAGSVSGHGNITQVTNVSSEKSGKFSSIFVPILAAVIGAYATHQFTLMRAPERTEDQTETMLGMAREALKVANSTQANPVVITRLEEIASQAQALQANIQLLKPSKDGADFQADFWLPIGKGIVLGDSAAFGVNSIREKGGIYVRIYGRSRLMEVGSNLDYKTKSGKSCEIVYVGSSDLGLHGFKTICNSQ
jgi:hypothetical protein